MGEIENLLVAHCFGQFNLVEGQNMTLGFSPDPSREKIKPS
jgi:hypothetical protein